MFPCLLECRKCLRSSGDRSVISLWFVFTGTVLVRPEPVDDGRDDFRGPEFRRRKNNILRKDFPRKRGG